MRLDKGNYNLLPNLQLLRRTPNQQKNTDYYDVWLERVYSDENQKAVYKSNSCIPLNISYSFENFEEFYKKRKELIVQRMKDYFDVRDEE